MTVKEKEISIIQRNSNDLSENTRVKAKNSGTKLLRDQANTHHYIFETERGPRNYQKDFPRKDIQRRNTRKASNEKEIYGVNKKILHDLTLEKYPRYGAKKKLAHTLSPSQANVYFRRLGLREKIVKPVFSIC